MTVLHPSVLIANILTSIVQVFQTKKFSLRPCLLCLPIRTSQERLKSSLKSTRKRNYLFPVNNTCFPIRKESLTDIRLFYKPMFELQVAKISQVISVFWSSGAVRNGIFGYVTAILFQYSLEYLPY